MLLGLSHRKARARKAIATVRGLDSTKKGCAACSKQVFEARTGRETACEGSHGVSER